MGAFLTVGSGFTNFGLVEITGGFGSSLATGENVLANSGTIRTLGSGAHSIAATIHNQGELLIEGTGNILWQQDQAGPNLNGGDVARSQARETAPGRRNRSRNRRTPEPEPRPRPVRRYPTIEPPA